MLHQIQHTCHHSPTYSLICSKEVAVMTNCRGFALHVNLSLSIGVPESWSTVNQCVIHKIGWPMYGQYMNVQSGFQLLNYSASVSVKIQVDPLDIAALW